MNQARIEQVGTPEDVYDRPASPFVYEFLGNVNTLRAQALAHAGAHEPGANALESDGQVYIRPHDIELLPHVPGAPGIAAVLRYIHSAGPQARLTVEQVQTREIIEVEVSRSELAALELKIGDLINLRVRRGRSFEDDYAI